MVLTLQCQHRCWVKQVPMVALWTSCNGHVSWSLELVTPGHDVSGHPSSPDVFSPPKFYQSLAGAVTWSQDTGLCLHLRLPTYWPPHPATIATARADIVTSREPGRYNPRHDTLASAGWDATDGRPSDGQSAGHNREAEPDTSEAFCRQGAAQSSPLPHVSCTQCGQGSTGPALPWPGVTVWAGAEIMISFKTALTPQIRK